MQKKATHRRGTNNGKTLKEENIVVFLCISNEMLKITS